MNGRRGKLLVALIATLVGAGAAVVPMVLTSTAHAGDAWTIWVRGTVDTTVETLDDDIPCSYNVDDEQSVDDGVDFGSSSDVGRVCGQNVTVVGTAKVTRGYGLGECDGVSDFGVEVTVTVSTIATHPKRNESPNPHKIEKKICAEVGVPYDFNEETSTILSNGSFSLGYGVN